MLVWPGTNLLRMSNPSQSGVSFVLAGRALTLTPAKVAASMRGIAPEHIVVHAVRVEGRWYPVAQVFEQATGISRRVWTTERAIDKLKALGLPLRRFAPWPSQEAVRSALISTLLRDAWTVERWDDDAGQHAIDIVASKESTRAGFDVLGFPTAPVASPNPDQGEPPAVIATPSAQAKQLFAAAVLAAMQARARHPRRRRVIVVPDVARYRTLFDKTSQSLADAGIELWWVAAKGKVTPATTQVPAVNHPLTP